jgi:hypothetical protein
VLTNAAREGARVAVIMGSTDDQVKNAIKQYATIGGVTVNDQEISLNRAVALGTWTGSQITIAHPFQFIVLNPVAKLVAKNSKTGEALTMSAVAVMRNEGS